MISTDNYSAAEIVKIIKACGEAGVTDLQLAGFTIKFKPKWVQEADLLQSMTAIPLKQPTQLSFVPNEPDALEDDLALTDPVEWQRQGLEAKNG